MSSTDQIVKSTVLRAPLPRVWRAITDATQFGTWFGVEFERSDSAGPRSTAEGDAENRIDGPFVAGARLTGRIVPTQVDDEIAKQQEPYRGTPFTFVIERIEPMRIFAFRWDPYPVDAGAAPPPMTLVTFELSESSEGTRLVITESGFDALPPERRAEAFASNEGGWEAQLGLITKYLAREAV